MSASAPTRPDERCKEEQAFHCPERARFSWGKAIAGSGVRGTDFCARGHVYGCASPKFNSGRCSGPEGGRDAAMAVLLLALMLAVTPAHGAEQSPQRPYSCRLYDDEQKKCAFGSCDQQTVQRLKRECLRNGGRP